MLARRTIAGEQKRFCYRIRQLLAPRYDSNRRSETVQRVRGCDQLLVLRLLAAMRTPETADVSLEGVAGVGPAARLKPKAAV
jgi:hypothetical protein